MKYSIIVPYHSNKDYLSLCLTSLLDTTPVDVEIIVVSNNKNGFDLDLNNERITIVRVNKSIGYAKAVNLGVETSKGKYLIISDSDVVYFDGSWFKNLTEFFHSNDKIGIASSKLINPSNNRIIDFGMALSRYNNAHPFMDRPIDFELTLKNYKVQMACSASMIIERKLFMDLGMHDVELVNFYNDTDICLKLKDFDKECWVVANSKAYHKGSSASISKAAYRGDAKSIYAAKNYHRMEIDLGKFFKLNYDFHIKHNEVRPKYLLVDCSTVGDREWFYEEVKNYFDLYDIYEFGVADRDLSHISLINQLNTNILKIDLPIIYFVDRFISLEDNALWLKYRDCSSDIIVDRNANITSFLGEK